MNTENVEILWNSTVTDLLKSEKLSGVRLTNTNLVKGQLDFD